MDDRDRWWKNYGGLTGRGYTEFPAPLRRGAPAEISAQPLFNYLLALSFEREKLPFGEDFNQNRLYRDLLEAVWERRWGKRQIPEIDRLEFAEFEGILKEISLAAWHAGARGVSASTVAELCARAGLDQQIRSFERGAEQGALSLMAAFYFKQTRRTGERAYEFTHKTFGEYLAACRLVDAIAEIEQERADKHGRRRPWNEEAALVSWIKLSGPAAIDRDLLQFVRRQIAVAEEDDGVEVIGRWQQAMAELLNHELEHALPMHLLGLVTFQEMTRQARNAEEALLAAHCCCASSTGRPSPIRWPHLCALRQLLARLERENEYAVVRGCLGWLGTHQALSHWLYRADLATANFAGANLEGANLAGANLAGANLAGANLVGVRRLDVARGLDKVKSWRGAKIERKWVERLGLDAKKLGLEVVDDLDEEEPAKPSSLQA